MARRRKCHVVTRTGVRSLTINLTAPGDKLNIISLSRLRVHVKTGESAVLATI